MVSIAEKLLLLLDGGQNRLNAFFDSLGSDVLLRFKLEEASGTDISNTGSLTSVQGTLSGTATLGSNSETNALLGIECDGATTYISFPHNAGYSGLTSFTLLIVARPDSAGEGSQGIIFAKLNEITLRMASSNRIVFERNMATTNALAITSTNTVTYGTLYAIAARIDTDKIPHIYLDGNEVSYGTQTTGVGDEASNSNVGSIASISSGIVTFDGGIFDVALVSGALTDAQIEEHYNSTFL